MQNKGEYVIVIDPRLKYQVWWINFVYRCLCIFIYHCSKVWFSTNYAARMHYWSKFTVKMFTFLQKIYILN